MDEISVRLAPVPIDVPLVSLVHSYVTAGSSPSGSDSLDKHVIESPIDKLLTSKDRESIVGARLPTVAVLVLEATPPDVSVASMEQAMTSLGLAFVVSNVNVMPVASVAPVV